MLFHSDDCELSTQWFGRFPSDLAIQVLHLVMYVGDTCLLKYELVFLCLKSEVWAGGLGMGRVFSEQEAVGNWAYSPAGKNGEWNCSLFWQQEAGPAQSSHGELLVPQIHWL